MISNASSPVLTQSEQEKLIEKLEIFKIQGRDKCGCPLLFIVGQLFPARLVSVEALKSYLEQKIYPELGSHDKPFSVVYVHTGVNRSENFPGVSVLKSIYDAIPAPIRDNLKTLYFLHPGLQSRLFLATFGRFLFTGGFYGKVKYVNRLEFLWDNVRRQGIEIPEFVNDYDEELDYLPMVDYGLESDHPRVYGAPIVDSTTVTMYSMRCIA